MAKKAKSDLANSEGPGKIISPDKSADRNASTAGAKRLQANARGKAHPLENGLMFLTMGYLTSLLNNATFAVSLVKLKGADPKNLPRIVDHFFTYGFESYNVYQLAIFDSMLNSLTSLALSCNPKKALGEKEIKISLLLSKSRGSIISEFLNRRSKEVSRDSFLSRIRELERIVEKKFDLNDRLLERLRIASRMRNHLLHEKGVMDFFVSDDLSVSFIDSPAPSEEEFSTLHTAFVFELGIELIHSVADAILPGRIPVEKVQSTLKFIEDAKTTVRAQANESDPEIWAKLVKGEI